MAAVQVANIRRDPPADLTRSVMPFSDEGLKVYNARNKVLFGNERVVLGDYTHVARDPMFALPMKHAVDVTVFSLFGVGFTQARAVSLVAFFGSIALIFFAVSRARTPLAGYLASLVFGLSTLFGMYFRLAVGYSLGMFFLALFLAMLAPVVGAELTGRVRWRSFLAGLVLAASVFCRTPYYGLIPGALLAFAAMDWKDGRFERLLSGRTLPFALAVLVALALRVLIMGYASTVGAFASLPARAAFTPHVDLAYLKRLWGFLALTGSRLGFATLLGGFYVVRLSFRRDRFDGLVGGLMLGQAFFICLQSYLMPRHFLAAWGLLAVMAGMALAEIWRLIAESVGRRFAGGVMAILIAFVILGGAVGYSRWLRTAGFEMVAASRRTGELVGDPDGKLIFGNMAATLSMENNLRTLALLGPPDMDRIRTALDEFPVTHFAHVDGRGYLPHEFCASRLFENRFRRLETFHLGRFQTTLYEVKDYIGENLYAHPGFDGADDGTDVWRISEAPGGRVNVEKGEAVVMSPTAARWSGLEQTVGLGSDVEKLVASIEFRTEGTSERGAMFEFVFLDGPDGRELKKQQWFLGRSEDRWQRHADVVTVPSGAALVRVRMGLEFSSGDARFRNPRLRPL